MIKAALRVTASIVLLAAAAPALAHMPYIAPGMFEIGTHDKVSIEASFTEDAFRPEIAMKDAPFEITGPDGSVTKLGTPLFTADRTLVEAAVPADGVYRLSSGQRLGRMGKMFRAGETWKMVGEDGAPPAGAETVAVQSTTLADAYVLRGKPTGIGALAPRGKALEIHPLADPTATAAAAPARFEVLFDGKPLTAADVTMFREAGLYDGRKQVTEVKTDSAGRFSVTAPDAGRYLLLVRHRAAAPSGAAAPFYSYTVTLAFEAG
ncbi:DUF4198 domain-containing protein [Novosphingobium sp. JCM 18896]|uniref:DUF4198 domain-containing protein n=1 Tax=Novosphingobium sp. JCM 18896 TaxID=2989731 RepID=UPI002221D6ED|nr:DUF4198 domain-containing protein [Novosphingobium sp. JCM 18896]MCW1429863.1 DUF4198 domain-containing protein [Novosphingobium sp. JCM 18896]